MAGRGRWVGRDAVEPVTASAAGELVVSADCAAWRLVAGMSPEILLMLSRG